MTPFDPLAPFLDASGALVAPRFGDLYFQGGGQGLAETRHVFLAGNHLAERFAATRGTFTIGETGFGTGLNFLAAWQLFRERAPESARLTWISIEAWPLEPALHRRALEPFAELAPLAEELLATRWRGDAVVRRASLDDGRVTLCVLVADVLAALGDHDFAVDAWCLDGFAPARNPAMWTPDVLADIARHTRAGGTFATFTAAGAVRRGLAEVGFAPEKAAGHGAKRHMLRGALATVGTAAPAAAIPPHRVRIAGAGLAGAGAARAFAERGFAVEVFDPLGVAGGASGQTAIVLQPRLGATPDARIVAAAFGWTRALLLAIDPERSVWRDCGVLHPAADAADAERLRAQLTAAPVPDAHWLDPDSASAQAGFDTGPHGAVWLATAGVVRPRALCALLLAHPRIAMHTTAAPFHADTAVEDDAILVIAAGPDSTALAGEHELGLRPTRGQATVFATDAAATHPQTAVSASGYCTPDLDGVFVVGGTYARGDRDLAPRDGDEVENRGRFAAWPELAATLANARALRAEVGVRATTAQHLPRVGALLGRRRVLVSAGHGSRGAATAPYAGEILAASICGEPSPVPRLLATRLRPQ